MLSIIRPDDVEFLEPVTDLSTFFLFRNLSSPRNPKIIASLKIIIFLFGTIKFESSLLNLCIFFKI